MSDPKAVEEIDIRTNDGWFLRADVHDPRGAPVGTAVLAHATMARRTEFDGPDGRGLARFFVERAWRVVAFDFRGHGDSKRPRSGATYSYDDLVAGDLPAVHAFARSRAGAAEPVVVVGHSLGGHVALAAQGTGLVAFDGVVAVGANVWLRDLESSRARWLVKRASTRAGWVARRAWRYLPTAALPFAPEEPPPYVDDFERYARTGAWTSADGRLDYLASLVHVRVPVLQIVSEGDRVACPPGCGARFVARCGGSHDVLSMSRRDGAGAAPGRMGLVTDVSARSAWDRAEAWMRRLRSRA